jgi:hypothetical protein
MKGKFYNFPFLFLFVIFIYKNSFNMKKIIFEKRQLKLREDDINLKSDSLSQSPDNKNNEVSVDATSAENGSPNLASDINTAKTQKPNATTFDFNPSIYADQNKSKTPTTINLQARDATDAANTINNAMKSNPEVINAVKNGNATVKANLSVHEGINFTKKELNEFLKNL